MKLFNKHFAITVILELIMFMAPTYLDQMGAAGEFVLQLHQSPIALQSR